MVREMRGVNALEGPELGAKMAQAIQKRVRNNTTIAQRRSRLRELAMRGGDAPSRKAADDAALEELYLEQARFMERQRMANDEWAQIQMQQNMANIGTQRNPPVPFDPNDPLAGGDPMWPGAAPQQFQGELGGTNAEEEALLAQMQMDMANQPGDQGFTSPGYVPGGASALPQAASVPQAPQVASPTGTSQSQAGPQGFTSPGYVPGGQEALPQATPPPQTPQVAGDDTGASQAPLPGPQGFTSPGYAQGDQAGTADTVASNALKWLNEQFKKDEQPPQTPQVAQGDGSNAGPQGFTSQGYVPGGGQREGESFMDFTQRQHQEKYPQQGMTPEEQQQIQQIEQGFQSSRPDANADASISWPTIGGSQTPGGFQSGGYNPDVAQRQGESFMEYTQRMHERNYPSGGGSADEIVGALLKQYGSQLEDAGYGEQLKKFASGNYTKADIDALIGQYGNKLPKKILKQLQQASDSMIEGDRKANVVVEELAGLDPNFAGGTTSSGSSSYGMARDVEGKPLGFNAKDYNPEVAIGQDESFMDYTQRMHERLYPKNPWVDPDRA